MPDKKVESIILLVSNKTLGAVNALPVVGFQFDFLVDDCKYYCLITEVEKHESKWWCRISYWREYCGKPNSN